MAHSDTNGMWPKVDKSPITPAFARKLVEDFDKSGLAQSSVSLDKKFLSGQSPQRFEMPLRQVLADLGITNIEYVQQGSVAYLRRVVKA